MPGTKRTKEELELEYLIRSLYQSYKHIKEIRAKRGVRNPKQFLKLLALEKRIKRTMVEAYREDVRRQKEQLK